MKDISLKDWIALEPEFQAKQRQIDRLNALAFALIVLAIFVLITR